MERFPQPIVSVIMPVYNACHYVEAAIKSILRQSFQQFELILIDDGSTDGSGEICNKMAKQDSRITVVHRSNGGICRARNCGLDMAVGKYIAFCDHDDIYERNYLEVTVGIAETHKADLVKCSYRVDFWEQDRLIKNSTVELSSGAVQKERLVNDGTLLNKVEAVIWNGLYLRSAIEKKHIRFDESVKYGMEDYLFNLQVLENVRSVWMLSEKLYIHCIRQNQSTGAKYQSERLKDILKAEKLERDFLEKWGPPTDARRAYHRAQFLHLYVVDLQKPGGVLSFREKTAVIRRLNHPDVLGRDYKMIYNASLLSKSVKMFCVSVCFDLHLYGTLLFMYTVCDAIMKNKTK